MGEVEQEGQLNLAAETPLSVQSKESRTEMQLRVSDWQRIRRDVKRLKGWSTAWFSASSLFLGVGSGAGLSLISLYNNKTKPSHWVVATHISIAAASGLGFVLCGVAGVSGWFRYRRRRGDLEIELDLIESTFPWGASKPPESPSGVQKTLAVARLRRGMDTAHGKRRYCDAQLTHLDRLRAKIADVSEAEWNERSHTLNEDIVHLENDIRANLFRCFPPGSDDLFDSDEGFDRTTYNPYAKEGCVTYLEWRITRLGQIRKRLST